MKYILIIILFVFATPLYADPVFKEYVDWITANSEFEYNNEELPTLKKIPKDQLIIYAYGADAVAEQDVANFPKIIALYNHNTNEIIVDEQFELDDFSKHHIIVHELVHFLQLINGYYDTPEAQECQASLEPIAYELHMKWMDKVDHPAEKPNELFLFFLNKACDKHHSYFID